jgi:carbamoyl-phosphate synthase small subunit
MFETAPEKGFTTSEKSAYVVLEDGTVLQGKPFGYPRNSLGEIVFSTGMVGYTEALTDPSYKGQILTFTYPLVGNYGVPSYSNKDNFGLPKHFESDSIKVEGVIVYEHCRNPSHWDSEKSLDSWLYEEKIPGVYDVDTRELTKKLRVKGVMMGALIFDEDVEGALKAIKEAQRYEAKNYVDEISVKEPKTYGRGKKKVVMVYLGVKYNIIRNLASRGFEVTVVPYNFSFDDIMNFSPDGIVISNGPGDPKILTTTIKNTKKMLKEYKKPILGICLGHQIVALALGADTYKLKFGHRGQNKPVVDLTNGKCYVTSQNHGYAVKDENLSSIGLKVWFRNIDDNTIEGLLHENMPIITTQFHPEASPGPYDTSFVFDIFLKLVEGS